MSAIPPQTVAASYSLAWILDLLERQRLITPAARRDLEVKAPTMRARLLKLKAQDSIDVQVSPAELVVSFGLLDPANQAPIDEDRIARLTAAAAGLRYHKIDSLELNMELVTQTLSRPFALRHVILPLASDANELVVAQDNPFDTEVTENLRRISGKQVQRVISSKKDILKCITEIYGFRKSVESAAAAESPNVGLGESFYDFEQLVRLRSVGEIEGSDQHIVNAVDFLFTYAFDQRASDIHIEPRKEVSQVRLRIDGVLHDVHSIPRRVHPAMLSRIKSMARLDIAERRRPQDGRIKTMRGDKTVEMRVSTLPVAFGEKVVLRIFDPDVLLQDLPGLGFDGTDQSIFERWLAQPHGLILITGPTGSGKTTTLYTALRALADDTVNITTVEDPIEMVTDIFNQVSVQAKIGVDFASALRTILRQDPDIIMVGEIRDAATAEMAVQAALTGHLVFSTLHTNDTATAVTRLLDLDVPPFLLSSTLVGVMAQRLLRRICPHCKIPAALTADQMAALGLTEATAIRFISVATGQGCVQCRGTGYLGRMGIFEVLDFEEKLRQMVLQRASSESLLEAAQREGLKPLRQGALDRLAEGVTSFEEVVRVTGVVYGQNPRREPG